MVEEEEDDEEEEEEFAEAVFDDEAAGDFRRGDGDCVLVLSGGAFGGRLTDASDRCFVY